MPLQKISWLCRWRLGTKGNSVADPKQKFRIRFRIRIRPEVSFGFGSRSETGRNFFVLKFLPSLIFKHKKAVFPQLHGLATNKVRNKFAGFGFGSISKTHGSADPDPYQKVTDPQQCVQPPVNVFYCTAIVATTCKCEICIIMWNHLISAWK